jgi:Coenzyme PQQ synthesis protein D (PqqD)
MPACLVFTPDNPELYTLNPPAWLILRLCDGQPKAKIIEAYYAAVEPMLSREQAERDVSIGLEYLIHRQIIEPVNVYPRKHKKPKRRLRHEPKA